MEPPAAVTAAGRALARQEWQAAFDAASTPLDDLRWEAERLDHLADACWWLGRIDECTTARERAHRAYEAVGERRRAGMCAVWLWEHHGFAARPAIAGAWLRRARRLLGDDRHCEEHGALLLREAETAHGQGDLDGSLAQARDVVQLARALGSVDLEAQALQTVGRVLIDRGEVDLGMAELDEAMLFAVEGRLTPYATGKVYCSLVSACEEVGDHDRAAEWTEATMRWAHQHPFAIFPGICRVHRAIVLKRRGELAEAEREAQRACQELQGRHQGNTAAAYAEVGDICRRLGRLDHAEAAFTRSQDLAGGPCAALALLRLAQGRVAQALSIATGCVRDASKPLARASLLPILVHVAVAAKELQIARDAADELDRLADRFGTPALRASALTTRGRLQLGDGEAALALDTLRDAADRWRALDVPYELATCRTLLGEALRECGHDDEARDTFAAAASLFEEIGAHVDATGVPAERTAALPAGLTVREVEVLRLVASGLTNNDIAASLHLSAKTVSRHLSNIFTKLGVSSRAAATAFAFEHQLMDRSTGRPS